MSDPDALRVDLLPFATLYADTLYTFLHPHSTHPPVPNYALSPNVDNIEVLRVVVRETLTEDMVSQLVHDILSITEDLLDKDSSAQSLATLGASGKEQSLAMQATTSGGKAKHTKHADLNRHPHRLEKGSGVKATGYSRQC